MKKIIFLTTLLLLIQGCAMQMKMEPIKQTDQEEIFVNGNTAIISEKNYTVILRPITETFDTKSNPKIGITVYNGTNDKINFSNENITVIHAGSTVRLYTYNELTEQIRQTAMLQSMLVGFGAAAQQMNTHNAGYSYNSGSFNSNSYGDYGNSRIVGNYSGYTYDPMAAQAYRDNITQNSQNTISNIFGSASKDISMLDNMIVKNTIMPNSSYGGYIVLDNLENTDTQEMTVLIIINNEKHRFKLKTGRI